MRQEFDRLDALRDLQAGFVGGNLDKWIGAAARMGCFFMSIR
jgi:hypothetical protein